MNLNTIVQQLRTERDRLDRAIAAITAIGGTAPRRVGRRTMSLAARRRIAAAQRARWQKVKAAKKK